MRVRTKLYSAAYAIGVKIIEGTSGRKYNVEALAPEGKRFAEGPHSLVESAFETPGMRNLVRAAMLERLEGAVLVDCDQDCDCREDN